MKYCENSNMNTIKNNNVISLSLMCILLFFLIFLTFFDFVIYFSDFQWSCTFVFIISFILILRYLNGFNIVSLYSLFFLTSLLFMGGRFVSIFLGYSENSLYELDFFIYKNASALEASSLFYLVMIGFVSLEVGYYLSKLFIKDKVLFYQKNSDVFINSNLKILYFFIFILFFLLFSQMVTAVRAVISGGYLAIFQLQTVEYSYNFSSLLKTLLIASCGVFLAQKNKNIKILFLILMGFYFTIDMILGGRGGFVCYLIFLVWYIYDFGLKKANILKFSFYVSLILVFLSTIFGLFSLRTISEDNSSIYQSILKLIYDQGTSLMVFNESRFIDNYPIIPFFQNFITGFSFIYSQIFGSVYPYDISFSSFISYKLNPELYNMGYGLGWAFFADAYQYGRRNAIFYSFFIIIFSFFLNFLQFKVTKNILLKIITISLVTSILFLPRSGLNTIFPLIPYILIIYILFEFLSKVFKK